MKSSKLQIITLNSFIATDSAMRIAYEHIVIQIKNITDIMCGKDVGESIIYIQTTENNTYNFVW